MAIVTGDRYLDLLARFVEEHAGALLDGSLVLKLNPVGLHYVQTRLDALHELDRLRTGAPVDYLRAYIADLGDHRALEQLSRVLNLLTSVKVVSVLPPPVRDPSPVTLSSFGRLRSLELRGCDLSTTAARGLLELRPILERLICHNSADALRHIFAERTVEIQDALVWSRLTSVSCAFNGMLLMDDSLHLLPAVQFLDLSRNRFAKAANLHLCAKLKFLDLGFNQLRNVSALSQVKSHISKLVLRNNALVSVHGIAALTSLEALDISHNLISSLKEIQAVSTIPSLEILLLEGNPLSVSPRYREEVFSFFADPTKVNLDGRKIMQSEFRNVMRIVSKRVTQQGVYGSYAPAESIAETQDMLMGNDEFPRTSEGGANLPRAKRKTSRLALIQDVESNQTSLVQEGGEQDETTGFHLSGNYPRDAKDRRHDALDEGDQGKVEAMQLMQKVEALKEEGSKAWLQELKVLLQDNDHETGQGQGQRQHQQSFELQSENRKLMMDAKLRELRKRWNRRHRRHQHRPFEGVSNRQQRKENLETTLGEEHGVIIQEHDSAIDESSVHPNDTGSQSGLNSPSSSPKMSVGSQIVENSPDPDRKPWEGNAGMNAEDNMLRGLGYAADEEQTSMDESFRSSRVIDEVVESRGSAGVLGSPPHYHEEVLQKRQYLEEELLRLSLDSDCAPFSSDSETSDDSSLMLLSGSSRSGDTPKSPVGFRMHSLDRDSLESCIDQPSISPIGDDVLGQAENTGVTSYDSEESRCSDPHDEEIKHEPPGEQHSMVMSSWPNVPKEKEAEASRAGHLNPACSDDILANAGGGKDQAISGNCVSKPKRKRKSRRVRTVAISEEGETSGRNLQPESGVDDIVEPILSALIKADEVQRDPIGISEREALYANCAVSDSLRLPNTDNVQFNMREESSSSNQILGSAAAEAEKGSGTISVEARNTVSSSMPQEDNLKVPVEDIFRLKIGNAEQAEICLQYIKCDCIRLWEESPVERDIYLLLSSNDMLYMLAEAGKQHSPVEGSDLVLHVIACHKVRDVKKVMVGLGLQALRVDIGHCASYLLVTRNVDISREILDMLRRPTENSEPAPDFESWEQRQLKMFEKLILGGARTNVLMYLMPLFCYGDSSENIWVARLVFLTSHHIFLCIEDLVHFGAASEDLITPQHPYFIMEASADIYDLSQVVAGLTDGCLTLNFEKIITGCSTPVDYRTMKAQREQQELSRSLVWNFKGVLQEAALKLVALLRASHMEVAVQPLTVKRQGYP